MVDPETLQDVPLGDEGELWVHGPQCFAGYWKREEDTQKTITADGWLRTGDIVRLDEDYFIQIVDRIKEVIHYRRVQRLTHRSGNRPETARFRGGCGGRGHPAGQRGESWWSPP